MCAKPTFLVHDSPSGPPPVPRFRFATNAKHMDMTDVMMAMHIVIRPSVQLCKLVLGRSALSVFKRPNKTVLLADDASSIPPPKKMVRFNEKPVTISRRRFFERRRRDSMSSPPRPCLVIRETDDVYEESPGPSSKTYPPSIYEDCLSDHPDFLVDLRVLEGDEHSDTRSLKNIRRSDFYEMESGIAMFDHAGYASYCLSRWLDKQREESQAPTQCVFEDPALLSWPSRTQPLLPPSTPSDVFCSVPPLPATSVCRPSRSLPWRICRFIEDELQNAIVVLMIGLCIHLCLFLFLAYDILTRGLIPSDD